jgi:hypothetical protein
MLSRVNISLIAFIFIVREEFFLYNPIQKWHFVADDMGNRLGFPILVYITRCAFSKKAEKDCSFD